jgi:hypothetical protein
MTTKNFAGHMGITVEDALTAKVRVAALMVPTVSLLAGVAVMQIEIRLGLLATAIILGWTQLVGL